VAKKRKRKTAGDYLAQQQVEEAKPKDSIKTELGGATGTVTTKSLNIQSAEQAVAAANVDMSAWDIVGQQLKTSEVTIGSNKTGTGRPETFTNFHLTVKLRRRAFRFDEVYEALIADLKARAPRMPKYRQPKKRPAFPYLLELSAYDVHYAKLAWAPETGESYDTKIAARCVKDGIEDVLQRLSSPPERILFPVGHDFFHSDTPQGTTAKGTRQDVDTRHTRMFKDGNRLLREVIERLMAIAPVDVRVIPGNHDLTTMFHLGEVLSAWFRRTDRVTVDNAPSLRKCYEYGTNLIGLTHGDDVKMDRLALIMPTEWGEAWGRTTHHEWHIGHLHTRKGYVYIGADSRPGVCIRVIPGLCGTDYWHYQMGFIGSPRAVEAYMWHKNCGYLGHIASDVRLLQEAWNGEDL